MNYIQKSIYNLKILPRWVIIFIDLVFIGLSSILGYLLRFSFSIKEIFNNNFFEGIALQVLFGFIAILITNSYRGIIRYTGLQDGVRIFYMLILNAVSVAAFNLIYFYNSKSNLIPYSVILISFLASFLFLFNYRLLVKYIFSFYKRALIKNSNVLIYGAGQTGIITKHVIDSTPTSRVVGFLENDLNKIGKVLDGSKIYAADSDELELLVNNFNVDNLIITVKNLSPDIKSEVVDICLRNQVKVSVVPPVDKWVRGELSLNQIKEINIEDLLERETIKLEDKNLERQLRGNRICITGAAGSIGSELVRQIIQYNPGSLILIDQAESPLFEIDRQTKLVDHHFQVVSYIADITNEQRIRSIFREHSPDIIFHAAAYKHVPMMEGNPSEAITCNILGTKILADLAVEFRVKKFVMISTDKAVNPTNVMGCSKRIAEIYVQSLNKHLDNLSTNHTAFVTTRFGNVMGSNGSVIPLFRKQIEQGGPVTVTHPEITRYFMTIPEACRLVLEAGAMGKGGEIFIFDMGQSVKILDLAKRMIWLSGLEPGKDIDVVFSGLREGEKLYEELLNTSENTVKTHHDKIMIAKVQEYSYTEIDKFVDLFHDLVHDRNELKMVTLMKELVPEFKSNYSRYEVLDSK
ncbi:MAG TPA: nucleoside-diphosphate sugar epimerase/dehydratase [Chryseolinea sp.]|nr:nucleoside-diphosphate sugar epimerase/dehydratase [Chryseolinea sp.]